MSADIGFCPLLAMWECPLLAIRPLTVIGNHSLASAAHRHFWDALMRTDRIGARLPIRAARSVLVDIAHSVPLERKLPVEVTVVLLGVLGHHGGDVRLIGG